MKISVILGTLNSANRITKAIDSILKQTYQNFELIICDDGSTDNTYEILRELQNKDNRIKIIRNESNLGLAKSLNKCLDVSTGEYIARMDDDDYAHPERFERQIKFLESNPKYSIVGTAYNLIDENGIWGANSLEGERSTLNIFKGESFAHPTTIFKKDAILMVKGYSTDSVAERTEDYDLWCKLYEKGFIGYNIPDILLNYYESRDSFKKRKFVYRINEYRLRKKWRKKLNISYKYSFFIVRPILIGILPKKVASRYHKIKFSRILKREK